MLIALSAASTSAFQLILPNFQPGDWLEQKFSLVHFSLPNVATNNFQGAFFWLPTTEIAGATQQSYPGSWVPVAFG